MLCFVEYCITIVQVYCIFVEYCKRADNPSIYAGGGGVRDTSDFTISGSGLTMADGQTIKKYQNFNYMTEIDPVNAVAIRKQYNWGRQPFEGGTILEDNRTVYLGADATPGFFTKFVADTPGDFLNGTTYVYKHDSEDKWIEIDNTDFEKMLICYSHKCMIIALWL